MVKKYKNKMNNMNNINFQQEGSGPSTLEIGEISRSILPQGFGKPNEYLNPDKLVREKTYDIFDSMMRDDMISPLIKLKKMLTLAFEFRIVPYDDSPEARKRADFMSWTLTELMERSIFKAFWHIIDHEWYGFSLTEIIYEVIETGEYKGMIGIKNLKSKPQKTFMFNPDEYGNLTGPTALKQVIKGKTGGNYQNYLDIDKFLHHTYNQMNENPYGKSHLSDIYRAWWCKDVVHHFYAKHLEQWGSPVIEAMIPPTLKKKDKQRIAQILNSFQHGTSFYHRSDIEFKTWKVPPPSHYENAIRLFDTAISRGLGVPDLLGFTSTGSGSYALGKEQAALFYGLIGVDRDSLIDLINYDLIPKLEDANFTPNGKYSYMAISRVKIKDFQTILDVFKGSYEAAGYNPGKLEDLNKFRSQIGLNEISPEEHEEYLDTWNNIRRLGRGQDSDGRTSNEDIVEDGNVPEVPDNPDLVSPNDEEIDSNEFSKSINNVRNKYANSYATNIETDFDEISGQFQNDIWNTMDNMSEEALSATVSVYSDGDVELQSKILESVNRGPLAIKLRAAHKAAHKRGLDSAKKEMDDIIAEAKGESEQ